MPYVIITDSTSDLSSEQYENLGIEFIPFKYRINEKDYVNDLKKNDLSSKKYYDLIREGKSSVTSKINQHEYVEFFKKYLDQGMDILYIAFSSSLSGSYHSSVLAIEELKKNYKNKKIFSVDSLCASGGQGLLATIACNQKKKGLNIESLKEFLEGIKMNICHWFTVDDLFHLKKGGRLSSAAAFFGSMLNIKPVLHMDNNGKLVPVFKQRGKKAAINKIFEQFKETRDSSYETIIINHADDEKSAKDLRDLIEANLDKTDITIDNIGTVIGAHTGPGAIALFFVGNKR